LAGCVEPPHAGGGAESAEAARPGRATASVSGDPSSWPLATSPPLAAASATPEHRADRGVEEFQVVGVGQRIDVADLAYTHPLGHVVLHDRSRNGPQGEINRWQPDGGAPTRRSLLDAALDTGRSRKLRQSQIELSLDTRFRAESARGPGCRGRGPRCRLPRRGTSDHIHPEPVIESGGTPDPQGRRRVRCADRRAAPSLTSTTISRRRVSRGGWSNRPRGGGAATGPGGVACR